MEIFPIGVLQWWTLEEKLMRDTWKNLREMILKSSNYSEELWIDDISEMDDLDLFFYGRRWMFNRWFKRNFNKWFYKDGETIN